MQLWGDSIAITRSFSALVSVLILPGLYWLCIELFESPLVGWIAIALTSVSLLHVTYAQEAREYSFWMLTIVMSSAALLYAMRRGTKASWAIYAVSLTLGLYTFALNLLILIGHAIHVTAIKGLRLHQTVKSYILSSLVAIIAFTPWLLINITHSSTMQETTNWISHRVSLQILVKHWLLNMSYIFLSAKMRVIVILLALIAYSFYFLFNKASRKSWVFILTLILPTALFLVVPDLVQGGVRSVMNRYALPCYLGIQLTVAYLLGVKISPDFSRKTWHKRFWQVVTIGLILAGIWTCNRFSKLEIGWNKGDFQNISSAEIINRSKHPLVIGTLKQKNLSFGSVGALLSLTDRLDKKVDLQLVLDPNLPNLSSGYSDVFFVYSSKNFIHNLEQTANVKIKQIQPGLWKLIQ